MWFFDRVASMCGDLQSKFKQTAERIGGVPYLGEYLSSPFYYIEHRFWKLQTYFEGVSVWADKVYNSADIIFDDLIAKIEAKWDVLTESAYHTFKRIMTYIPDEWPIVRETWFSLYYSVRDELLSWYSILSETKSSIWSYVYYQALAAWQILRETKTSIWNYVYGQALWTWSILGETKTSFWVWIENNKLEAWFDAEILKAKTRILGFVTAEIGYLTSEWFKFLDNSWSSVKGSFSWLTGKLLDIVDDEIDEYKDKIWNIIEKLVEKI